MFHTIIQQLLVVPVGTALSPSVTASPDWWGVLAGLHPVLTHFPIALIIVAAGVEFVGLLMRREKVASFTVIALLIGGSSAMFSAWSGWSLADAGYGRGWELELHRWLGVAAGLLGLLLSVLVLVAWFGGRSWATSIVRALSFVCAILIGLAAHFGGELVWGKSLVIKSLFPEPGAQPLSVSDHAPPVEDESVSSVTPPTTSESTPEPRLAPETVKPIVPKNDAVAPATSAQPKPEEPTKIVMVSFKEQIEPILDTHCWKCHGPTGRARAGLRLVSQDDFEQVLDEHPVVSSGAPDQSELFAVITLPRDDDDAMPPNGPGLSSDEIALVRLWIEQGGSTESAASGPEEEIPALENDPGSASVASSDPGAAESDPVTRKQAQDIQELSKVLLTRGVPLKPIEHDSNFLELDASALRHRIEPPFGDDDIRQMTPLSTVLVVLDISHTEVTDSGLTALAGFDELQTLTLKGTSISSESVDLLASLTGMRRLNLFETQIDDSGLQALMRSSSLRRLFVGSSRVTDAGVKAARSLNPDVTIIWSDSASDSQ